MAPSRASSLVQYACANCAKRRIPPHSFSTTFRRHNSSEAPNLPRVANPSFWSSLIPRPFRRKSRSTDRLAQDPAAAAERRAGIMFFLLGILVGSNAIQILMLRREHLSFTRETDARLGLLREVIQKVKDGEPVDVRKALGTGDPEQEKEWERVLREVEDTDMLWEGRKKRDQSRAETAERTRAKKEAQKADAAVKAEATTTDTPTKTSPKFFV